MIKETYDAAKFIAGLKKLSAQPKRMPTMVPHSKKVSYDPHDVVKRSSHKAGTLQKGVFGHAMEIIYK